MTAKLIFMVSTDEFYTSIFKVFSHPMNLIPLKCSISDYVGHMKLVNGQTITEHTVLDEVDISDKRHLCVHVQTHE